ncbi:MAG: protein kinase [Anaerolineae bacterium]
MAQQDSLGREVVIKLLSAQLTDDSRFMERFEREAQLTVGLQHPNIVPVYDYGTAQGRPYMIMAYIPGGSLRELLNAKGFLRMPEFAPLLTQIAVALDYAHEKGVIHRDIKPANVLLDESGSAILTDFGIARAVQSTQSLTAEHFVGTASHIAPEMVEQTTPVTHAADIYGLGVLTFEMLTGKLPYTGDSPIQLIWAHVNEPVPDITTYSNNLPRSLDLFMNKAMAKDPANRYASAAALAEDFAAIATGERPPNADRLPPPTRILGFDEIGTRLEDTVAKVIEQVVKIVRSDGGSGSGIVLEDDTILTSLHVVDGAPGIYIQFRTGERTEAEMIALQRTSDLALLRLKVSPQTIPINVKRAIRLEPARMEPGERLVAIGHPLDLDWSVTGGHYNGLRQPNDEAIQRFGIPLKCPLIQVDVSINPGNSGGPVIDIEGRMVGNAVSIINPALVNNIGFAVYAPTVLEFYKPNRDATEPLIPYTDRRHHEPGLAYSPTTGKPISPVPQASMMPEGTADVFRCFGCGALYAMDRAFCPRCGKPRG